MFFKRNTLLLVALLAICGCSQAASRRHTHARAHSESELEREFALIESGDDEPEPEISHETSTGCEAASKKNSDDYIDKVLAETRPKIPEPAFLPERSGRLKLFNGTLENLSHLKRVGPALVRCTESSVSFLIPVGLKNLTGRYFWEMDTGLPVFRGFIDMFIGKVEADVLYTRQRVPDESGTKRAVVEKFQITKLDGVKAKFDGLGAMNRIASRITDFAAKYFNRGLSRALEGPVRNAINKELLNIKKYEKYYF